MKDTQLQLKLSGVPKAKQGREVPPQWAWTEAVVWTERMLATLERGIKGGQWFSLIDKVWKMENLQRAAAKVAEGKSPKKPDGRKCRQYAEQSARRLPTVQRMLQNGYYQPKPANRVNRYSNTPLLSTATGSVPGEEPKARYGVSHSCCKAGKAG